jgi:hypothetical protein
MLMDQSSLNSLDWRVASACEGGACIMVARHGDMVLLGNTDELGGPVLSYTKSEWRDFLAGVKLGDFEGIA